MAQSTAKDDVLYPRDEEPYTGRDLHVRIVLFVVCHSCLASTDMIKHHLARSRNLSLYSHLHSLRSRLRDGGAGRSK
jgi:hypothetical protein